MLQSDPIPALATSCAAWACRNRYSTAILIYRFESYFPTGNLDAMTELQRPRPDAIRGVTQSRAVFQGWTKEVAQAAASIPALRSIRRNEVPGASVRCSRPHQ